MDPDDIDLTSGGDESSLEDLIDGLEESAGATESRNSEESGFEWITDELDNPDRSALESVREESHILVLAPRNSSLVDDVCIDLSTIADPVNLNVLTVSASRSMDDLVDHWRNHATVLPKNLTLVRVGRDGQPDHSASVVSGSHSPATLSVRNAPDPSDLTRLGISIANILNEWDDSAHQTRMCFHSITALLQYTESERLFRFLHLLQSRIDRLDGGAHYHMDPTVHDNETINVFRSLFDATIDLRDDEFSITTQ